MSQSDNPMLTDHGPRDIRRRVFCRSCNDLRPIVIPREPLLWMCLKCPGVPWQRDYYACAKWEPRSDIPPLPARAYDITCPGCGAVRPITEWSLKVPRWKSGSSVCHDCKMKVPHETCQKKRKVAVTTMELNGCRLTKSHKGARCDGLSPECDHYSECSGWVAKRTAWGGWTAERIQESNHVN